MASLIPPPTTASQAALAATMVFAAWMTFVGVTPPHANKEDDKGKTSKKPDTTSKDVDKAKGKKGPDDFIRSIQLTSPRGPSILFSHLAFLAGYAAFLAYNYDPASARLTLSPDTKSWTAPYCSSLDSHGSGAGSSNGLSASLLTWTPFTAVPLLIVILIGAPLRLIPYSALAQDFTFALTEPDRLVTSGIYSIVQHPSYTGLAALFFGNSVLYYRYDTPIVACLCPPGWMPYVKMLLIAFVWPAFIAAGVFGISVRVRQEEKMLKAKFGKEWESWNTKTARFIPYVF